MKKVIYTLFVSVCMLFALNANAQNCAYNVSTTDTFGDGWAEGQQLTVTTSSGSFTYGNAGSGLLFVASTEDYKLPVANGDVISWSTNAAWATFAGEHSFTISGPTGDICGTVPFGTAAGGAGTCNAICPCATAGAGDCTVDVSVTDVFDSFGDGWDWDLVLGDGNQVPPTTLNVTVGSAVFAGITVVDAETLNFPAQSVTIPQGDCVDVMVEFVDVDRFPGEYRYTINIVPTVGAPVINVPTLGAVNATSLTYVAGAAPGAAVATSPNAGEVCCPAPLENPAAQCGIYCIGKDNFVQDLCAKAPTCGPGNGCPTPDQSGAVIATASLVTPSLGNNNGISDDLWGAAAPNGFFTTLSLAIPPAPAVTAGGDACLAAGCVMPLEFAGGNATICWNGDNSFSGEDIIIYVAGTASTVTNLGGAALPAGAVAFIDGTGGDCNVQCVTIPLTAAQIAAGTADFDVRPRNYLSSEDFCSNGGFSDDTFTYDLEAIFIDPCTSVEDAACINWFADECATDPIAMGSCLGLDVINDLIATGCLPGVSLVNPGIATLYATASCADGMSSSRIGINLAIYDCDVQGGCPYFLVMEDLGADGWDGATINVSINEAWPADACKVTSGACEVKMLVVNDGGFIDLEYWNGANEAEHSWRVLDVFGNTALDINGECAQDGPSPAVGVNVRVKADCPENTCSGALDGDFCARVTMGAWPEFQSWEIYEGGCDPGVNTANPAQGPRKYYINAETYAGLPPGAIVDHTLDEGFDYCQEYTLHLMDAFNAGWTGAAGGATWELLTTNKCYGPTQNQYRPAGYGGITRPADDAKMGWYQTLLVGNTDFGDNPVFTTGGTDLDYYECWTFPCKPVCGPATAPATADPLTCLSTATTTLPIPAAEICYPQCNHGLGCDVVADFELLVNGDPINTLFFDVDFAAGTDAFFGAGLPVGCHKGIWYLTYCDGVVSRCTFDFTIAIDPNPTMVCNDNVTISLKAPDANPTNGGWVQGATDDIDECVIKITPDMVLEAGVGDACAANEYSITILDTDGTPLNVLSDRGLFLDDRGLEIPAALLNCPLVPSTCLVGKDQVKQTLTYVIEHKPSGNKCWGEMTIEDKTAPLMLTTNYAVYCNDPDALNATWEETTTFDANEMPANIAGGAAATGQSDTWIPINIDQCFKKGAILSDIKINVNLTHSDITDLQIALHLPAQLAATFGSPLLLDGNFQAGSANCYVPFHPTDSPLLNPLVLAGLPCTSLNSPNPQFFNTETSNGTLPANIGDTWYIQVIDNDVDVINGLPVGNAGQVTSASITVTCGFPTISDLGPAGAIDCSLETFELLNEMIVETDCDQSNWVGARIMRTYKATDCFGNSSTADAFVDLCAPPMSEITKPGDVTIECDGSAPEDIGIEEAGGLMYGCEMITADQHGLCDVSFTWDDTVLPTCGSAFKIIREWTIINWCSGTTKYHTQTIKVEDSEGPSIPGGSATVGTTGYDCSADVTLEDLGIEDNCSGVASVTASYLIAGNPYLGNAQYAIVDLMAGEALEGLGLGANVVTITAKDSCLQSTVEDVTITVIDDDAPFAVCDDDLHISLNGDGVARLYASDFDEGSSDNCGDVTLEIRSLGCMAGDWAEYADFACCDLGAVTVELRVTDAAGNTNICWADLLIEDPLAPIVTCKPDLTLDCNDEAAHDPFTEPDATDNCSPSLINTVDGGSLDNCGAGTITRTWTYSDGSEKSADASCTQRVTLVHVSDFTVQFPPDVEIDTCPDELGDTGEPIILDDDCELVAINHEDLVLTIADDACYKILRTWTLINWCVYDEINGTPTDLGIPLPLPNTYRDDDGYFKYVQVIKVLDEEAPTISFTAPDPCDYSDGCEGEVDLVATASDDCSNIADLTYEYKIDAFSDGSFDITGNGDDASGSYPYGDHQIKWIVTDGCGNETVETFDFSVQDCKNPTPVCLNGISIEVMNDPEGTGCVPIWAEDLLEYAFDNCSEDETVEATVLIRRVGDTGAPQTSIEVCCDDVPNGQVLVEVWVEDEAGNSDYCETYIIPQDNLGNCPTSGGGSSALLTGEILRETDMSPIEDVMVDVNGTTTMTNASNGYSFNLPVGVNYTVAPEKDINPLNGVTTYDLVLISQHIIGTMPFNDNYKMIAADVNGNGEISTFDMVQLRQLILYVITDFPTNTSWRFVDMDYSFPLDPQTGLVNPWAATFPEVINVPALPTAGESLVDFVGIKTGDVNNSAIPNSLLGSEDRNFESTLVLNVDDVDMTAGQTYTVDFIADEFTNIAGYQFTMNFDKSAVDFGGVEAGALNIGDKNFGTTLLDEGIITTSYNEAEAVTVANGEVLFSLTFTANTNTLLSEVINVSSRYTVAEAYDNEGTSLDVAFGFNTQTGTVVAGGEFELLQNKPNPFNESTLIGFNLPEATSATLRVFDVSGKTLRVIEGDFARGYNEVSIERSQLQATGVLYYQLDTDTDSATKKMILID